MCCLGAFTLIEEVLGSACCITHFVVLDFPLSTIVCHDSSPILSLCITATLHAQHSSHCLSVLTPTGQAVSNVFDGVRDLDGAKLKGITCRCRIGFLSLFEVRGYMCEVG